MCKTTMEERALTVFTGGVNSPVRSLKNLCPFPLIIKKAYQDILIDSHQHMYIDYCTSWGALIHGHGHPQIVETVQQAVMEGSSFGLTSEKEILLGEFILKNLARPDYKIRFVSSGTEATMTAARLARGVTGRDIIVKFDGNYHGHSDVFLINSGSALADRSLSYSKGVPWDSIKNTLSIPFNDIPALQEVIEKYGTRIAAIIFEPIPANMGVVLPKQAFLQTLICEARKIGALLIADEVYTGFRVAFKGAQDVYNFQADITVFGKIIGGGFPVAALCARKEIMHYLSPEGDVFQAGTLSGNPVSMAAGRACLQLCQESAFYSRLEQRTQELLTPIERFIESKSLPLLIVQKGSMFSFFFTHKKEITNFKEVQQCHLQQFKTFFTLLLEQGIFLSPSPFEASFVSSALSQEHLEKTREIIISVLTKIFENE